MTITLPKILKIRKIKTRSLWSASALIIMNPPPLSVTPHEFVPSFLKIAKDLITGSVLSIFYMLCFALLPEKESF